MNSLFWKISLIFLFILILTSAVYIYISVFTAEMYFQETRQKLDTDIAAHIAGETDCFIDDSVNTKVLENVFHNVMVINPSIEVYLLDKEGKILSYYAPDKIIRIQTVPLEPIKKVIDSKNKEFLLGLDPKNPLNEKAFSAAEVFDNGIMKGYIYVILGGEEYENASQLVFGSYILRLGVRSMIIALVMAAIIGFVAIGYITRNLRKIIIVIREFKNGNINARIRLKGKGEISEFANSFNDMADTIVRNIEEIKSADKLRRDLVANVSHDLRTPISIIRGYIETILIKDDKLTPEERRIYLETILSSTEGLLKLVEELFELSGLEAKDKTIDPEVISLTDLLQDIHQKNLVLAGSKNISMILNVPEEQILFRADIRMMEKAFQNLIDNAIKFTDVNGTIELLVSEEGKGTIVVSIKDNGLGIEKEQLPNIFEKYYQIKRVSEGNNKKGLGLGLAIVKKIIDLHGFKIEVLSEIDKGTEFRIFFPRR